MSRTKRQSKILDIIGRLEVETQEELVNELKKAKFEVTQATISRDIKELGLIKVLTDSRKYKYAVDKTGESNVSIKMINIFRESVISIHHAENIIVAKTLSGSASSAALLIDKSGFEGVLGCIAGDDTIFVVLQDKSFIEPLMQKLNQIIN